MKNKLIDNNNIMLTILVILFFSIFILGSMSMVRASDSIQYAKSFISIEVESGDTLTSIAKEYAISVAHYSDYVEEVKNINNLKDDRIYAGCYLMIPVYQSIEE